MNVKNLNINLDELTTKFSALNREISKNLSLFINKQVKSNDYKFIVLLILKMVLLFVLFVRSTLLIVEDEHEIQETIIIYIWLIFGSYLIVHNIIEFSISKNDYINVLYVALFSTSLFTIYQIFIG